MKHRKGTPCYIWGLFFLLWSTANGEIVNSSQRIGEIDFPKTVLNKISNGIVVSQSRVKSKSSTPKLKKTDLQELRFEITGLHKRECRFALRKISRYEEFEKHISFVKKSRYSGGRINLRLHSSILPVRMVLDFKIPRITKVGKYPFTFDKGFLKGLVGMINVIEYNNRCLFYTTADWTGPDTGFPNMILEFFSSTLSTMSMNTLFRISNN